MVDLNSERRALATHQLSVLYFASVREGVGVASEEIELPPGVATVGDFLGWMRSRGDAYSAALSENLAIRMAVDRVHANPDTKIQSAKEIAIFPMMTGG